MPAEGRRRPGRRRPELTLEAYYQGVVTGDRQVLGRAITLVESERDDHRELAARLLSRLLDKTGNAVRVGITGVPGVGKSTFIDALGTMLTADGSRVAVLAVDPSSERTGGSILGDKTRMARLARDPAAFIRPSPAAGALGGVTGHTMKTLLLCEAAGFDVVLVETVGVGQSETAVAAMTDFFLVLMLAGAGDELQGIKRGVLELADAMCVNKADGDNLERAKRAAHDYRNAIRFFRPKGDWTPPVLMCSALHGEGLQRVWETVMAHRDQATESGSLDARRRDQAVRWMWRLVDDELRRRLRRTPAVRAQLREIEDAVREGSLAAPEAAARLMASFLGR